MAISKIKAIKTTLDKALDYICNPSKTEKGLLVSSFGCTPETADIEMRITAEKGNKNGNRVGYHLMQSFSPEDDISPQKALELGKEFAAKITKGRHEYVIATHIDGDHIHNHIIFNATSFIDYKKYHHQHKDTEKMQQINDEICKKNNLSVVKIKSGKKAAGKYEYEQKRKGESWKEKLITAIDQAILKSNSLEEFIGIMELDGYEIKKGKYLSFKAPGQEKFIRNKRLGEAYSVEAIEQRISNKEKIFEKSEDKEVQNKKKAQKNNDKKIPNKKLNLLADISKNIKARESKGYHTALVKSNINTLVKTMNYLAAHNLQTVDDFEKYYNSIEANYEFLQKDKIRLMSSAQDLTEMIKFIKNYKENKYTFVKLQYAKNKEEYVKDNKEKLVIFQSAKKYFEVKGLNPDELKTSDFFEELKIIKEDKKENSQQLKKAKEQYTEIDIVRKNIEMALNISFDKKEEMEIKDKADKSILGKLRENVEMVEQQKKENKEKEQKDIQER